jgi:hypothetical protein
LRSELLVALASLAGLFVLLAFEFRFAFGLEFAFEFPFAFAFAFTSAAAELVSALIVLAGWLVAAVGFSAARLKPTLAIRMESKI